MYIKFKLSLKLIIKETWNLLNFYKIFNFRFLRKSSLSIPKLINSWNRSKQKGAEDEFNEKL